MKTLQRKKSGILKKIMYVTLVGLLVVQLTSCDKETTNDNQKAKLTVRMTDAPANYEAVMVDVQGVEVTGNGGSAVMLNTTAKVYNLLELSNGVNALIATGDLNAGAVSQIRLILGTNNSVKVAGVVYPLTTPSAMQSGLKLQVNKTFEAGVEYSMLLDFDASQSIVLTGNNEYQLKPVIRTIDTAISGSIKGSVSPLAGNVLISATSNGVTYTSVTAANGSFLIAGLPLGTYDITITPTLPLQPITITGKTVVVGASTDLGITILL
ncbi:MAG: DUF4382 domain-containing protein [Prolixibacteraceae bacterium]|nr:DUF4382 domain-containing protein [Prolixibacteraceae bacterium]